MANGKVCGLYVLANNLGLLKVIKEENNSKICTFINDKEQYGDELTGT